MNYNNNFYQNAFAQFKLLQGFDERDIFRVKLSLLSQGLFLTEEAHTAINRFFKVPQSVRSGASSGLDIVLPGGVWVNAPISQNQSSHEHCTLMLSGSDFILQMPAKSLEIPALVLPKPDYYFEKTSLGNSMDKLGQIFADRIGFGLINQCYFWKKERRCAFCTIGENIKNELHTKPELEILETLDKALEDRILPPKHILLSGGTFPDDGWTTKPFAKIAKLIKAKTDLTIYLMAVPPNELSELDILFESGITEIALNIEIFSKNYAEKIIPGKYKEVGLAKYIKSLQYARKFWGQREVRSLLVAGLEPEKETLDGVKAILDAGATPILSAFRPLPGSMLADSAPPSVSWLESLYFKAQELAKGYGTALGPECDACKANCIA